MSKPKTGSGWLRGAVLIGWGCETRQKKVDCWAGGPRAVTDGQLSSEPRPGFGHRQRPFASLGSWAVPVWPPLLSPPLLFRYEHPQLLSAAPASSHQPPVPEHRGQAAAGPAGVTHPVPAVTHHSGARARWVGSPPALPSLGLWGLDLVVFICVCVRLSEWMCTMCVQVPLETRGVRFLGLELEGN